MPAKERSTAGPVLLTDARYLGTLAAARCLGRRGVSVSIADPHRLAPVFWSSQVSGSLRCPPLADTAAFVDRLLEIGRRRPGHLLYPSSDDAAWVYARHAAELSRDFVLWQPPLSVMEVLLNKRRLVEAAQKAGLRVPSTQWVENESQLERIGKGSFPLLIKPQTQVLFDPHMKGWVVEQPADLAPAWRGFQRAGRHGAELLASQPDAGLPLLQAYEPSSARVVYTVAGFIDETGDLFAAAASRKVLQVPDRLGVGICFEEAPLDAGVARALHALCRDVGYFGVFEVEFLDRQDGYELIDFNPRFYGEMAFEIDRWLPLPWLVYLAAQGRREELQTAVEQARAAARPTGRTYCDRRRLKTILWLRGLFGTMEREEIARWRRWPAGDGHLTTDPVYQADDRRPAWLYAGLEWASCLRHPRAVLRQVVRSRVSSYG